MTGKDSPTSREADGHSDGSRSLEPSPSDAVWMEAGNPASANYLAASLFATHAL